MYHKTLKRKDHIRQVAIYILMACTVFVVVTFITLFMLGFRFDTSRGSVERYAFLQFASSPSGASVSIDGEILGPKTPSKISVPPGEHQVVMWREGYKTWKKSVDIKAGTLTWLNYTLLVPTKLTVEAVSTYATIHDSLSSPNGNSIIIEPKSDTPIFDLVDLSSDKIKQSNISLPKALYSEPDTIGMSHVFNLEKWDEGSRYVLVSHKFGDNNEWLLLDTQRPSESKNISRTFNISISSIVFADSSGNMFYVLEKNDIRKLDLGAGTISRPLVGGVSSFSIYRESKVITYVGSGKVGTNQRVVGVYREGDEAPYVMRTVSGGNSVPLRISTTNYFNENYVAISEGDKVDILSGSYPNTTSDNTSSMKVITSFKSNKDVLELSFSPIGKYLLIQNGESFASYDLEYRKLSVSNIDGSGAVFSLRWLDDNHLWSDRDGKLTIREFDGADLHKINDVVFGQDATLTNNGRYIYSVNQAKGGFQLQRVRMILP